MSVSFTDYVIIGVVLFAAFVCIFIYSDVINMGVKINSSYDSFRKSWDAKENVSKNVSANGVSTTTVSTTISTTTSTLVVNIMHADGAPSILFRTYKGDILVDCGSNASIMDKMFMNGVGSLRAVFISKLDASHAGGCSRTMLMIPTSAVFDSMGTVNASWFKNYNFAIGTKRADMGKKKSYVVGGLVIDILGRDSNMTLYHFTFGNFSMVYLGGCGSSCIGGFLEKKYGIYMVDDDVISDEQMLKYMPRGVIIPGNGNSTAGIARKYGIQVHSMKDDGDLTFTTDGVLVGMAKR